MVMPCMASICEAMLETAGAGATKPSFRDPAFAGSSGAPDHWLLQNEERSWSLKAKRLVLSGTLLAHPRSLEDVGLG